MKRLQQKDAELGKKLSAYFKEIQTFQVENINLFNQTATLKQ